MSWRYIKVCFGYIVTCLNTYMLTRSAFFHLLYRFLSIDTDTVNAVTLADAKSSVMSQLLPGELEISTSGDFDVKEVLELVLKYLGSIPEQETTFNVVGNINEHGLIIGETTFGGLPELDGRGTGQVTV